VTLFGDLMTTGYSGRPLAAKLGIKPGFRLAVINPPPQYWALIHPLPDGVSVQPAEQRDFNCIHLFVTTYADLDQQLGKLRDAIVSNGMIWVSWPKRSANVPTDVTEDRIRALALTLGLVDVKVCAIDVIWSGLKLVIPVKERR
jgi:hypothetical protein